ncbi:MAG: peptidoglycan recognition family protein [Oscillospiraceae bacterium]|jgi:hypothetical protein
MALNIISTNLNWKSPRVTRSSTKYLIIHHAAGTGSVYDIHEQHRNHPTENYIGIAYNFYIRKDGSVYEGRGWEYEGGHTGKGNGINYNSQSIGICCEGYYHEDENNQYTGAPSIAQLRSLIELGVEAKRRYSTITSIGGHNDYNSTACPGNRFPKDMVISAMRSYNQVKSSANTLKAKGVINTADYWVDNFWRVTYLDELIINCAAKCKPNITGNYTTVQNALNRLAQVGIINTPSYWLNNYYNLQYLDSFIISAANHA